MKFKAQINGKPIKNPFLKLAVGIVGVTLLSSVLLFLALPLIGLLAVGGVVALVALPFVARFGKISQIRKNVKPVGSQKPAPRLVEPTDPP